MTDSDFLDDLQRRAANSLMPAITRAEWTHLEALCCRDVRLVVIPSGPNWSVAPDSLVGAVRLARRELAEAVTRRLRS